MKKFFTLIAAALMTVGASAQKTTLVDYAVTATSVAGDSVDCTAAGVKLNVTTVELKNTDMYGAKLPLSDAQFVKIDMKEALKAGDEVTFKYFVTSNSTVDNTNGITVYNNKKSNEGTVLSKYYCQIADKKTLVSGVYTAAGGEKRLVIYATEGGSSVYFGGVTITRDESEAKESTIDLTGLNTLDALQAAAELTECNAVAGKTGDTPPEDKVEIKTKTANVNAVLTFKNFPMSITYKNSSADKVFLKTYQNYFQVASKGETLALNCKAGQKIYIYPSAKTSAAAAITVTGCSETSITIPASSTDVITLNATSGTVTLATTDNGFCMTKMEIKNAGTAINEVNAAVNAAAASKVIKTANYIIKNGVKYNYAGQQMK